MLRYSVLHSFSPWFVFLALGAVLVAAPGCRPTDALPEQGSDAYRDAVSSFFAGVAAAQAGSDAIAEERLRLVTELAPGEPAAWANLGLLALRRNELEPARASITRALTLAPDNSRVHMLAARMESDAGQFEAAVEHLRRAYTLEPKNLEAGYTLLREIERQGQAAAAGEIRPLLDELLRVQPDNLVLLFERIRLALQEQDAAAAGEVLDRLTAAADWPPEARELLETLRRAVAAGDTRQATTALTYLRNTLLSYAPYRQDLRAVQTPVEEVGSLFQRLLRLPSPSPRPAPPDLALTFEAQPPALPDAAQADWAGAVYLSGEAAPEVILALERTLRTAGGATLPLAAPLRPGGVAPLDYNFDFQTDLAAAGPGGFQLFLQDRPGTFVEVTDQLGLPSGVTGAAYAGVWVADVDSEGDLDLVLATPDGAPVVLRNNGDGTFVQRALFEEVRGLRGFLWADLDIDGDPDPALLDAAGGLHLYRNERRGHFEALPVPQGPGAVAALAPGDLNQDGVIDLVVLSREGSLQWFSPAAEAPQWTEVARWDAFPASGEARLLVDDLDNNGALDLVASTPQGSQVWLSDEQVAFAALPRPVEAAVADVADLDEDGRIDLLGNDASGRTVRLLNRGEKDYHWQVLRPQAAQAFGDQRINSFGIGGQAEIRSGLLYQMKPILRPLVHFGLGDQEGADVVRIIWPNGDVQAEFDLAADQTVRTPQRLKGSCPWLFTFDGEGMQFVTDFLWRSPLGLSINAQEAAGIMMTEDWVKIRGDQLVPRDGYYDVRITAELWETHFFDHVSLLVVDHPADTEVFVDERFAFPPPPMELFVTAPTVPVARAHDEAGRDVTALVRDLDARYLATFAPGRYQGVAEEHFVEVDLDGAPEEGPLWLVAAGWIRPTDSSINVALSQGTHPAPQGLSLEVPDGRGGWRVARSGLGFPAGKTKTILLDLSDVFAPGQPRRLRLRTNMEIYWDRLAWAAGRPEAEIRTERLAPAEAELRYRGFSALRAKDRSSPELPYYEELESTVPRWRDLTGYYTRFGDVRPLLKTVDDRYVIMNAGDEMRFRFPVPPPPPEGWVRDFVLIGDGWEKDGDLNTFFSDTVEPLPSHGRPDYSRPVRSLQEDPVYREHAQDWQEYHTRYVTPEPFFQALLPRE